MPTVRAMTITVDSLLPRPKCGCNRGYDVAVKGLSVVVKVKHYNVSNLHKHDRILT